MMDDLEQSLNTFFDLHQQRWQSINVKGIFNDPLVKEFYKEVARTFMEKDWLHFTYLTLNNEMVCGSFGFIFNRKIHTVTAGRNPRYSKYSIGHIHDMYLIEDAITNDVKELDFLKGDESYKYYWTNSAREYIQIIFSKKGWFRSLIWTILSKWLYLGEIQRYSLREIYSLYRIRQREKREKAKMGIKWLLKKT
jgi:CelD/BcsL family acetyltransferase involved in cellulose biosynthesis